jgi:hypothetical protein
MTLHTNFSHELFFPCPSIVLIWSNTDPMPYYVDIFSNAFHLVMPTSPLFVKNCNKGDVHFFSSQSVMNDLTNLLA